MSKTKTFIVVIVIIIGIILLSLLIFLDEFINWIVYHWLDLIITILMAIIAGLAIESINRKFSAKSKMSQTTVTPSTKPRKSLAKLILKDKHEFLIKEYERIFGREDFVGVILTDNLLFIGKEHFKITRMDDGYYIEDLDTKNGTLLNGDDLRGLGKRRLKNNDDIMVAKTLDIKYFEENI